MQVFNNKSNKSLTANVHIRVRRGVIQVPVEQPRIRTIVPVTAELSDHALHIPMLFNC